MTWYLQFCGYKRRIEFILIVHSIVFIPSYTLRCYNVMYRRWTWSKSSHLAELPCIDYCSLHLHRTHLSLFIMVIARHNTRYPGTRVAVNTCVKFLKSRHQWQFRAHYYHLTLFVNTLIYSSYQTRVFEPLYGFYLELVGKPAIDFVMMLLF